MKIQAFDFIILQDCLFILAKWNHAAVVSITSFSAAISVAHLFLALRHRLWSLHLIICHRQGSDNCDHCPCIKSLG